MSLIQKYNNTTSPVFTIGFPAVNPTEEEAKRLAAMLEYVVKSFNEKNITPVEVGVMSTDDICPRSIYWGD